MNFYAIIPARKGSKRLPGKNKKILGGKPLIQWTIECAKKANIFEKIIVSTDDSEIAEISENLGCTVPGLRDNNLASDTANLVDVCLNVANQLELNDSDVIVLLQPTSPFRKPETILRGLSMMKNLTSSNVISFSPCEVNPEWIHFVDNDDQLKPLLDKNSVLNQQQKYQYLIPNGLLYITGLHELRKNMSFFSGHIIPMITLDNQETLDIDTEQDWQHAVLIMKEYS